MSKHFLFVSDFDQTLSFNDSGAVMSEMLIPVPEDILGYDRTRIHTLFEQHGVIIQEWDRVRTDWLTIQDGADAPDAVARVASR